MRRASTILVAACIASFASQPALSQPACAVVDPDLVGHYEGGCVNGLAEGEGFARGASAEYRGEFRAGRKHGRGTKTWPATGEVYEGEYRDDLMHGRGAYRWGPGTAWAGERYEGEYRDGKRHGAGTYTFSSGDRYSGPWENDAQTGPDTPMQIQRRRASKAAIAAMGKPGTRVCATVPLGISHRRPVEGEVTAMLQDRLLIRVSKVDGQLAARQDVRFWDIAMNWRPCRAE